MIKVIVARITHDEGLFLEGEEPSSSIMDFESNSPLKATGNLKYKLKVSLISGGVLITGNTSAEFSCLCDKCRKEFSFEIKNDNVCHLYEGINDGEIDLTDDIREDILINLPQRLLCRNNCQGICFKCGQNLNEKKCSCAEQIKESTDWNELDKLKLS